MKAEWWRVIPLLLLALTAAAIAWLMLPSAAATVITIASMVLVGLGWPSPATRQPDSNASAPQQPLSGEAILLGDLSHELRTPMSAMLGYVDLLAETPLGPRQRSYVDALEAAGNSLVDIIDDILDVSELEAGATSVHEQPFAIRDCLDGVTQMLAPSAYEKRLDFYCIVEPDVPEQLIGDPLRVRQVLVNLVSNAIKYTEHGHVRVTLEVTDKGDQRVCLQISVDDTGIGIDEELQSRLFTPFTRASRDSEGTGLGLSITRRLCESMDGSVGCVSEPGTGSTFSATIWLRQIATALPSPAGSDMLHQVAVLLACRDKPFSDSLRHCLECDGATVVQQSPEALLHARHVENVDAIVVHLDQGLLQTPDDLRSLRTLADLRVVALVSSSNGYDLQRIEQLTGGVALSAHVPAGQLCRRLVELTGRSCGDESGQHRQSFALPGLRVLVAEDDLPSRQFLQRLLGDQGAEVDLCRDGDEALALLDVARYDVAIFDVRMPGRDGVETTRELRQRGITLPIIGLTAAPAERDRALIAGMTHCLLKPARSRELITTLRQWLPRSATDAAVEVRDTHRLHLDDEMLATLQRELPLQAEQLQLAQRDNDQSRLLDLAHRLNGTASICGFELLRHHAARVEGLLRNGDTSDLSQQATALVDAIEITLDELQR
ncbi:MAG: response regulator [Gammaproteobacteria bacterium]|nr:response regulator [Gammaproteobacteria bacterium]